MQEYYNMLNNKEQRDFIRMYPAWFKEFNRSNDAHLNFNKAFDAAKKDATPSRLVTVDKHLKTANLMIKLLKGFS